MQIQGCISQHQSGQGSVVPFRRRKHMMRISWSPGNTRLSQCHQLKHVPGFEGLLKACGIKVAANHDTGYFHKTNYSPWHDYAFHSTKFFRPNNSGIRQEARDRVHKPQIKKWLEYNWNCVPLNRNCLGICSLFVGYFCVALYVALFIQDSFLMIHYSRRLKNKAL